MSFLSLIRCAGGELKIKVRNVLRGRTRPSVHIPGSEQPPHSVTSLQDQELELGRAQETGRRGKRSPAFFFPPVQISNETFRQRDRERRDFLKDVCDSLSLLPSLFKALFPIVRAAAAAAATVKERQQP